MKAEWDQLINACMADCLQAENPQELFNGLNRLKIALECWQIYNSTKK